MELFKHNTTIDFMGARKWTAVASVLLFIFSIGSLIYGGINWGLDFTGGTQIELIFPNAPELEEVRNTLNEAGFPQNVVQNYGSSKDVMINIAPKKDMEQKELAEKVLSLFSGAKKNKVEYIGPQVGKELASKGLLAVIVSLLATMIYIAMRFEYRFAICSVLALVHDPLLILGIFSFYQIEFDLKSLAALLAIIGYSLNDTIVVFDRVRENFRKYRKLESKDIMNMSINQTLSRTIMTSVLTLIVVASLFIYGGEALRGFSLTLIIGIIIGTYSSIYIAGSFAVTLGLKRSDLISSGNKDVYDYRP